MAALAAISAGAALPFGLIRWAGGYVSTAVAGEAKTRQTEIASLKATIESTIGHKTNNNSTRIDGLERARQSDIERIVKVETSIAAIDKSLERVEHGQEKLAETINDRFDILAESIREVRTVSPRS